MDAQHGGSLVAADEEVGSSLAGPPLSPLVSLLGLPTPAGLDVLNEANADSYWGRSDLFDMALDLTAGRRGLAASPFLVSMKSVRPPATTRTCGWMSGPRSGRCRRASG